MDRNGKGVRDLKHVKEKYKDKDKEAVCFIRPRERGNDYWHDAMLHLGYRVVVPYRDYNLLLRVIRELWFRLELPKQPWFHPGVKNIDAEVYIIKDSLMTADYITWLRGLKPGARLLLDYDNRAAASLDPDEIEDGSVEKWSYDLDDCKKYGMKLKPPGYLDCYRIPEKERARVAKYDVVYVGRDKGRAGYLFWLEKKMREMGLRTYFRVSPTRSFYLFKDRRYRPVVPYAEYIKLANQSKAILNIMPAGQKSLTMRDFEAVFNNIKCITNNASVKGFELYDASRFFVIDKNNLAYLPEFLKTPFKPVDKEKLKKYTMESALKEMINGK